MTPIYYLFSVFELSGLPRMRDAVISLRIRIVVSLSCQLFEVVVPAGLLEILRAAAKLGDITTSGYSVSLYLA